MFFSSVAYNFPNNVLQVFNGFSSKLWEGHLLKITIQPSDKCDSTTDVQECYLIKVLGKTTCRTLFNVYDYVSLRKTWKEILEIAKIDYEKQTKKEY